MCLRSLHVTTLSFAFTHLVHTSCFFCPTAIAKRLTSSRWWISSDNIFLLFAVDSLDHQRCGCRPRPAFPFATVPIISSWGLIQHSQQLFLPSISDREFFISESQESRSIWKSCAFPNSYSSKSDNVGSFSFVDIVPRLLKS